MPQIPSVHLRFCGFLLFLFFNFFFPLQSRLSAWQMLWIYCLSSSAWALYLNLVSVQWCVQRPLKIDQPVGRWLSLKKRKRKKEGGKKKRILCVASDFLLSFPCSPCCILMHPFSVSHTSCMSVFSYISANPFSFYMTYFLSYDLPPQFPSLSFTAHLSFSLSKLERMGTGFTAFPPGGVMALWTRMTREKKGP